MRHDSGGTSKGVYLTVFQSAFQKMSVVGERGEVLGADALGSTTMVQSTPTEEAEDGWTMRKDQEEEQVGSSKAFGNDRLAPDTAPRCLACLDCGVQRGETNADLSLCEDSFTAAAGRPCAWSPSRDDGGLDLRTTICIRSRPYLCFCSPKMNGRFSATRDFRCRRKCPRGGCQGGEGTDSSHALAFSRRARNSSRSPAASLLADDSATPTSACPRSPTSPGCEIGLMAS